MTIEDDLEFPPFQNEEGEGTEDMTFEDIYGQALLSPVKITIPHSAVQKVKTGVKNHKSRLMRKASDNGIEMEKEKLVFETSENSEEGEGWVDLTISIHKPASVRVKRIIPIKAISLTDE